MGYGMSLQISQGKCRDDERREKSIPSGVVLLEAL